MATYTNKNIKNLFDLSIELYGDSKYVFKLIDDNLFTSIQDIVHVNMIINYDDSLVYLAKNNTNSAELVNDITLLKAVTIGSKQSIYDIALQYYGRIEDIFTLVQDNLILDNINNANITGLKIYYTEQKLSVTEFYKTNKINLSTGIYCDRSFDDSFDESFN